MVTATIPAARRSVPWRRLARAMATARRRIVPAAASGAGSVIRGLLATVTAVRGVAGLALVAYGCWLAYHPAGFVVGGVLLLVDRLLDERRTESP